MTLVNILIMDDGEVKMAVPEGNFLAGSKALTSIVEDLQQQEIPLDAGPVEQHSHSHEDMIVHQATHTHTH